MPGPATDRLNSYVDLLRQWNASINLISRRDMDVVWQRHIEDSLQLGTVCGPLPARAIDLGSGAGLPGLILAIAFGIHVDLIEEDQRKCAFLREAARVTEAPVTVHATSIEAAQVEPAPLVTARGLAALPRLLDYAEPLLAPGGACWFPKTRAAEVEMTEALKAWSMRVERVPSRTDPNGMIFKLSEISRRSA
jgi:16S rRNA (guanine527-N7)-methyltransferase